MKDIMKCLVFMVLTIVTGGAFAFFILFRLLWVIMEDDCIF